MGMVEEMVSGGNGIDGADSGVGGADGNGRVGGNDGGKGTCDGSEAHRGVGVVELMPVMGRPGGDDGGGVDVCGGIVTMMWPRQSGGKYEVGRESILRTGNDRECRSSQGRMGIVEALSFTATGRKDGCGQFLRESKWFL